MCGFEKVKNRRKRGRKRRDGGGEGSRSGGGRPRVTAVGPDGKVVATSAGKVTSGGEGRESGALTTL